MTTVWLIRHAEPDASVRGRCYGSLDAGLSPAGREQAARLAERLNAAPFAALYSSPRRRAIETAQAIGPNVSVVPEFRELGFGDFEGRIYDEIAATHPDLYRQWMEAPTTVHFPNGESFTEMRKRVLASYRALLAQHAGSIIGIVAHGGVARIILADALGMPDENIFRIAQRYGALNLIRYLDGYASVELVNA
jgi:broad specificity phosphatase PhoE